MHDLCHRKQKPFCIGVTAIIDFWFSFDTSDREHGLFFLSIIDKLILFILIAIHFRWSNA